MLHPRNPSKSVVATALGRRRLTTLVAVAVLLAAAPTWAQFQTCANCNVAPMTPDPLPVRPCDSGTLILGGMGFMNSNINGCSPVTIVDVRSTRPDRLQILSFTVLADGQIQVDYTVPCNAPPGLVAIDVTIDDISGDGITPLACGNARLNVDLILAVTFDHFAATATRDGIVLSWTTLEEIAVGAFEVRARVNSSEMTLTFVGPHGPGSYEYRVPSSAAKATSFKIVERSFDGSAGDETAWVEPIATRR